MTKLIFLLAVAVSMVNICAAQPIPAQSIEDTVLGWKKVYHFKGAKQGLKVDNRVYSIAQLSLCDSFANWMQASYLPRGGWGDVTKKATEKLGLYNQHTAGKPQSYGVYAKTYTDLKYNSQHKLELYSNSHVWWEIAANAVYGWPVRDICTPSQYYFTLPTAETENYDPATKMGLDLTKDKNTKPYISFWMKNEGFGGGTENVLLCKDNKSPFIKITKGEYFQLLEAAIPRFYELQKKKIFEAEQGVQGRIAVAVKSLDARMARLTIGLQKNREKYNDQLTELATLTSGQPGLADLENGKDLFSGQYLTDPGSNPGIYSIYKIDPTMAELCKKDEPQWILVSWEYFNDKNAVEKQQHDAILGNFNLEYVYNFFFAPEKIKGQTYKPLRSPYSK